MDECPFCGAPFSGEQLHINPKTRKVYYRGVDIFPRSNILSEIFIILKQGKGECVLLTDIMDKVYGPIANHPEQQIISVYISDIRKVIARQKIPILIISCYGKGWRMLFVRDGEAHVN